ncbi:DUF1158 family protein [Erwinia tasmaniensis]|uniref:DUF1158 domain-containing protein n=1 Tax=Erwinia tasmaniensis (strain DSM 17950 / CFBP 7177 / CIP 109463 / NCPPB 4357 / Et1/99) TaxID=465817 RepID=B2VCK4_ERWT9|nr:DUF1158 family protein [Erwinia tasmaniensis]CAO98424.1 Conserved hypothetical protein YbdJ [Erwinia tasmaniensis Et1/99]
MKNPFDTFLMPMSTLLLGFLSALLLPAPWFGLALTRQLVEVFHLEDIGQLYTLVFCLWFLVLGALEYYAIRFIWLRFVDPR